MIDFDNFTMSDLNLKKKKIDISVCIVMLEQPKFLRVRGGHRISARGGEIL